MNRSNKALWVGFLQLFQNFNQIKPANAHLRMKS